MRRAEQIGGWTSRLPLNVASGGGLGVFENTLVMALIWLDEIVEQIGPDRQLAWKVLSAVLPRLRCALKPDLAVDLGSHLPRLVRGIYFERCPAAKQPLSLFEGGEFVDEVARELKDAPRLDPRKAISAVFASIDRHVAAEHASRARHGLPWAVRQFWPAPNAACSLPASDSIPFIAADRSATEGNSGKEAEVLSASSSPGMDDLAAP